MLVFVIWIINRIKCFTCSNCPLLYVVFSHYFIMRSHIFSLKIFHFVYLHGTRYVCVCEVYVCTYFAISHNIIVTAHMNINIVVYCTHMLLFMWLLIHWRRDLWWAGNVWPPLLNYMLTDCGVCGFCVPGIQLERRQHSNGLEINSCQQRNLLAGEFDADRTTAYNLLAHPTDIRSKYTNIPEACV